MIDTAALLALQSRGHARGGGMAAAWPADSAMDEPQLTHFLETHSFCVLATAGVAPDGMTRPLARPVAFLVVETTFWFASGAGTRLSHLRRAPWASLTVIEGDRGAHRGVVADGPVAIHEMGATTIPDATAGPDATIEPSDTVREAYAAVHGGPPEGWAAAWCALTPTCLFSCAG